MTSGTSVPVSSRRAACQATARRDTGRAYFPVTPYAGVRKDWVEMGWGYEEIAYNINMPTFEVVLGNKAPTDVGPRRLGEKWRTSNKDDHALNHRDDADEATTESSENRPAVVELTDVSFGTRLRPSLKTSVSYRRRGVRRRGRPERLRKVDAHAVAARASGTG